MNPLDPQPDPTPGEGDIWEEIIATLPAGPLRDLCASRRLARHRPRAEDEQARRDDDRSGGID